MITQGNDYLPGYFKIFRTREEAPDVYTIELRTTNEGRSGQFFMVSVLGVGEAPISVASGHKRDTVFTIRSVGKVTSMIRKSRAVGVRGPYGNFWPWEEYDEIVAVAGGIGIPPIRSLIEEMTDSGRGRDLEVLYGSRTPSDLVYKEEIKEWEKNLKVHMTVDSGDSKWTGKVGFVTSIIKDASMSRNAAVFVIGPPLMMMNSVREAIRLGFREDRIFMSLERRMECGIGVCGHCNVGEFYVCESGPIFNYSRVKDQKELFL
jgi:NAD(P)H-flavin reductase